jgi:hypothetical protein
MGHLLYPTHQKLSHLDSGYSHETDFLASGPYDSEGQSFALLCKICSGGNALTDQAQTILQGTGGMNCWGLLRLNKPWVSSQNQVQEGTPWAYLLGLEIFSLLDS